MTNRAGGLAVRPHNTDLIDVVNADGAGLVGYLGQSRVAVAPRASAAAFMIGAKFQQNEACSTVRCTSGRPGAGTEAILFSFVGKQIQVWRCLTLMVRRATLEVGMRSVRTVVLVIGAAVGLSLALMSGSAGAYGSGHGGGGGGHASSGHSSQSGHAAGWVGHGGGWVGHGGGWRGDGWRHHGYGCCGWGFGFVDPFWYPYPWFGYGYGYGYDYPYGYVAPPVVTIPQADTYAAPLEPAAQSYWYYCPDSKTYYPYVRQCASGWQRVAPTPPH
jgi:hypothetical protein